jgi:hypothetical protein
MNEATIAKMDECLQRIKEHEIQNAKAAFWPSQTLTEVLRQLRRLDPKPTIKRDYSAGTIIVAGPNGRETLRGVKSPQGWVVRYDSKLIERREN